VTLLIGSKIGEQGIARWLPEKKARSVQEKIKTRGSVALATSGLMPPPFPLSAFVLACGALGVKRATFLVAFGIARLVRFGIIAAFALMYGTWILRVIESSAFQAVIAAFAIVAIAGTAFSVYRISRTGKKRRSKAS
jgi:membrane protein DedA with SNARE-associated domain